MVASLDDGAAEVAVVLFVGGLAVAFLAAAVVGELADGVLGVLGDAVGLEEQAVIAAIVPTISNELLKVDFMTWPLSSGRWAGWW